MSSLLPLPVGPGAKFQGLEGPRKAVLAGPQSVDRRCHPLARDGARANSSVGARQRGKNRCLDPVGIGRAALGGGLGSSGTQARRVCSFSPPVFYFPWQQR